MLPLSRYSAASYLTKEFIDHFLIKIKGYLGNLRYESFSIK